MIVKSLPIFDFPNIHIRQLERKDLMEWYAYLSLPVMMKESSWKPDSLKDLELIFNIIESSTKNSPIRFAIVETISEKLIGTVGFHTISDFNKTAELSYDISPEYWNLGIASIICKKISEWGFSKRGWVRIQATILETNKRSERVLLKCGFVFEGILRSFRIVNGLPKDFKMYSLTLID